MELSVTRDDGTRVTIYRGPEWGIVWSQIPERVIAALFSAPVTLAADLKTAEGNG